ncbi:MAG TPA: hypothetical protein VFK03_01150 [Candidatus Saccharimonadales bacterium]|nr:hypothetical protein [Candidatus Saccharimonadales bacterium]
MQPSHQEAVYRVQSVSGWTTYLPIDDRTMRRLENGHPRTRGMIVSLFCANIRQTQGGNPGMIGYSQLEFTKIDPDSGVTPDSWR